MIAGCWIFFYTPQSLGVVLLFWGNKVSRLAKFGGFEMLQAWITPFLGGVAAMLWPSVHFLESENLEGSDGGNLSQTNPVYIQAKLP